MEMTDFNIKLREEVDNFKKEYRNDNSALLIWFLKNIFCLDEELAVDSVCDGPNDKGIDGIWVDEDSQEIYIFQSKYSPKNNQKQGDRDIREFLGVKSWFDSEQSVESLLNSSANKELKNKIQILEIGDAIGSNYRVIFIFITNKIFDKNAIELVNTTDYIEAYDNNHLFEQYTYIAEEEIINTPKQLNVPNTSVIEYSNVGSNKTIVLAIPANEILKLDGIQDHSLFSRNVRYWVGRTRVNRDIQKTLIAQNEHSNFFLYHNGVTLICGNFEFNRSERYLKIEGYQVINGCQSILSFYENRSLLSDNIYVLTKIIKVEPYSSLIQKITHNTNNQNAISIKDLKSNDRIQIGLQNRFMEFFDNRVLYKIKKGESEVNFDVVINIDFAAQLIEAFYLKEPYNTHLKTKMFTDNYNRIFSRKMTCQKIFLSYIIYKIINENSNELKNQLIRDYGLAKFTILGFFRDIFENDDLGKKVLENPDEYVKGDKIEILKQTINDIFKLMALDINSYIDYYIQNEEYFDYKNLFKNKDFIYNMNTEIIKDYNKYLIKSPESSLGNLYSKHLNKN